MPDSLGGKRMAIYIAKLARAGMTPDWLPRTVPRCVPVETKSNQHGERSTTIVVGTERVLTRSKWRSVEVLAHPVTLRPHPEQIACAWRGSGAGDRKMTTLCHISGKDQNAATVLCTQKSVECMRSPMLNNSSPGQAAY